MTTTSNLWRVLLVVIVFVILGFIVTNLGYRDKLKYSRIVEFSCVKGFWQVTIDQKTQPIFIQPGQLLPPDTK